MQGMGDQGASRMRLLGILAVAACGSGEAGVSPDGGAFTAEGSAESGNGTGDDSGAGAGTDGSAVADGSPASDGMPPDAGYSCTAPGCTMRQPQLFTLTVSGDPSRFCTNGCGGWLSIETPDGGQVSSNGFHCGQVGCCACQAGPCPGIACLTQPFPDGGLQGGWGGETIGRSTCGAAQTACEFDTCVGGGSYVAVMCAYESAGDAQACSSYNGNPQKCVRVPFTFPGGGVVAGTVAP